MNDVELKEVLTAFTKSFEEACIDLNKNKSTVSLEEVEFTFDVQVDLASDAIIKDSKRNIRGLKFKKIEKGKLFTKLFDGGKVAEKTSNFQVKLTLSNNI